MRMVSIGRSIEGRLAKRLMLDYFVSDEYTQHRETKKTRVCSISVFK